MLKHDFKCPNKYKYLSRATMFAILSIVCEEAAVQGEGQAKFSEVTPHALTALSHDP